MPEFVDETHSPLNIYLAYTFLPASQYAKALLAIDELYEVLARTTYEGDPLRYYLFFRRGLAWRGQPWPPLCLDRVETGQSITFRFAHKRESAGLRWSDGDLSVVLPRSTVPLVATGALLAGGAWAYDHYLDAEVKRSQATLNQAQAEAARRQADLNSAQVDAARSQAELNLAQAEAARKQAELSAAQAEETRAKTKQVVERYRNAQQRPLTQPDRSTHVEIHSHIQNFYSVINQPNITRAEVNGINVLDSRERTD